ncbi:MAG: serine--tRNA ligase [Candidatus Nanopelagicales bacterium]
MIDLRVLRDDPERVRASQTARGEDPSIVDRLVQADERRRRAGSAYDGRRAEQKTLGKDVARASGEEKQRLLDRAKDLAAAVKQAEADRDAADVDAAALLAQLHNLVELDAPVGGEEDFVTIEEVGKPRDFAADGFEPRDHVELGRVLGAIDVERAAKVSGSRFYFLTGVGALLELALVNHAMSMALQWGFTPVIPPALVRPEAMDGTGFLGQAAENVYRVESDDLYLVGTSEVALAAYHSDEILPAERLPLRYAGFSPCFRREAGSHGKDTRGIIRVHQFDKVEMFSFVVPEQAQAEHQRLLQWERAFLDTLEVPYRVIDVATGDLGASAARKYDCEAWIPTQHRYRELTSTSNCGEFQARRLGIRLRDADGVRPLATLNGTLVALPRTIVAILENHQQADGSVVVPAALRGYLGRNVLEPFGA